MRCRKLRRTLKDIQLLRAKSEDVDIGFWRKCRLWLKGYLSESYLLYSFDENSALDYVPDIVRLKKTPRFNRYYAVMLYDKLYFSRMLRAFAEYLPVIFGLIRDGRFHHVDGGGRDGVECVLDLCRHRGTLVIKPIAGSGGEGVHLLCSQNGGWLLNNRAVSHADILSKIETLDDCLVTEFVEQHAYARRIYPHTANTVRIVTMWDDEVGEPFIAACSHRFGSKFSAPVDNCGLGGYSVGVDLETGRLTEALMSPRKGNFTTYLSHPETDQRIAGVFIPGWDAIKRRVVEMASSLAFLQWIGWDLIVTEDGLKVIEGNNYPDLKVLQLHTTLLKKPRVRRFFDRRVAALDRPDGRKERHKLPFRI